MNKKFLTFGIIGLFAFALVSAAVYVYVSNTSTVDVSIDQKMQTWVGDTVGVTSIDVNTFGGDSFNFKVSERNNGNSPAEVYNLLLDITAPVGTTFEGTEFTAISTVAEGSINLAALKFIRANGTYGTFSNIKAENLNNVKLMFSADGTTLSKFSFGAGNTHVSDITITTASGIATGIYTIKVCTIDNLVGATCA